MLHIEDCKRLTDLELIELLNDFRENNNINSFNRILLCNMPLVIKMAKAMHSKKSEHDLDDLISEATIGLRRAIELFDYKTGNKFSTYALHWVREYLSRWMYKDKQVRVSLTTARNFNKINNYINKIKNKEGRTPSAEEVSENTNISVKRIKNAMVLEVKGFISCDYLKNEYSIELPTDEIFTYDEDEKFLTLKAVSKLSKRERIIIINRFGLLDEKRMTLDAISKILNITRERVRQIEIRALKKLKKELYKKGVVK